MNIVRLCAWLALAAALAACSDVGTSPPTAGALATARPTGAPTVINTVPPTRAPEPTATPATIHIGGASGQPVYLYNSPTIGDRIQAYPEGTPLLLVGGDVEGDGLTWHFVRAPDGTEGYVPVDDTRPADTSGP